jgi:two-component system, cell cycle sensor histidine kinase and response regulator CckA
VLFSINRVSGWKLTKIAIFKGLLFILCTSLLLFFLIARLTDKIKQSTTALLASEERLRFLVKNSSDILVIVNADGSLRYVSPAAERITGFPTAELEGRALDTLIHPNDRKDIMTAWNEAVEHPEKTVTVQYRHIHKTREWVFSEAIAQSFLGEPAINGVIASVRDITERKRAEMTLLESEKLYRSLFENMMNGFAYCRMLFENGKPQDFIYLAVNDAFERQTGLKDVVGRKVTEVIPGIRDKDLELFEIYGRVAMTQEPTRFEMFVEALQMWFSISVYSPAHEHFVAVFDVITERKQAEALLSASEEKFRTVANHILN